MDKRQTRMGPSGAAFHMIAAAAAMVVTSGAHAIEIDTGNPDLKVRADTTLRYNLGVRAEKQDPRLLNFATTDEGNAKFKRGDIVTNRVDVLGELDVNYKGVVGARVSAAAWYDHAYRDPTVTSPAGSATSYNNNRYSNEVNRFVHGPSGEILDAFVWSNFELASVPVNVKLGKHTVVWGEGMLIGGHAISYGQSPIDGVKAVSSPGIETKEVFLPINQLTFKAQVTDKLSIAGQYALEWKPTRVPYAGTYLMGADNAPGVDRFALTPCNPALGPMSCRTMANTAALTSGDKNWGLSARLDVDSIESTLGAYYRVFNDTNPETGIQLANFYQAIPGVAATTLPGTYRFVYPAATKVIGVSLSKPVGPVSVGAELSWRKDAHLNSVASYTTTSTGAVGDTFHAVVNGVYLLPKTGLWDTGSVIGELAYSRLNKITANERLFRGVGYAGCVKLGTSGATAQPGDVTDTCSTKNYWEMAVRFTPQYLGILPSWDLSVPMALSYGLKGTAATGGGGFEGRLSWSIGLAATYASKHDFTLTYADASVPTKYNAAGTTAIGGNALNSAVGATDRGRLLFTYKTSF
ncbi:MAG: DUF1302 family protein [Hydrogenophaga sp.]|uniref:DUF1302 domain-containing protein n=1 Tax=Hydrogenophaga sp. TaxID=1904254 RepID=UPI00272FADA7|nr:DUF1302 family protein [Hydrogenophaga sp.]MDP2166161.1 DUF1302 family protein [Hydrogenophaga sp.]MDP3477542.1 DUF1302 family protein [Hydrogenophaga sp.]